MTAEHHPARQGRTLGVTRVLKELTSYQPTDWEKSQGLSSSISSVGSVGKVNRFLARVFRQEETDIMGFFKTFKEDFSQIF